MLWARQEVLFKAGFDKVWPDIQIDSIWVELYKIKKATVLIEMDPEMNRLPLKKLWWLIPVLSCFSCSGQW